MYSWTRDINGAHTVMIMGFSLSFLRHFVFGGGSLAMSLSYLLPFWNMAFPPCSHCMHRFLACQTCPFHCHLHVLFFATQYRACWCLTWLDCMLCWQAKCGLHLHPDIALSHANDVLMLLYDLILWKALWFLVILDEKTKQCMGYSKGRTGL